MFCIPKEIFEPEDFLESVVCGYGKGILNDPVSLSCGDLFCKQCIEYIFANNPGKEVCPVCRSNVSLSSITPQPGFTELINSALVKCPRCQWGGNYEAYCLHEKKCSPPTIKCPKGCGLIIVKKKMDQHLLNCKFRKVCCNHCRRMIYYEELMIHEKTCPSNLVPCPKGCNKTMVPAKQLEHLQIHPKCNPDCDFAFCGCYSENVKKNKTHINDNLLEHLLMLGSTVGELLYKADIIEHVPISHETSTANYIDIKWNNGKDTARGIKESWSFFISEKPIPGNFVARIKINSVGVDKNGWKICLGLFTSDQYTVGTWGAHKNGYGYILNNGNKVHVGNAESYGVPYDMGNIVSVEYKNGNITFYVNEKSQGIAFKNVKGSMHLVAAISSVKHEVQILNVVTI